MIWQEISLHVYYPKSNSMDMENKNSGSETYQESNSKDMNQTAASYIDLQTSFLFYFIGEFCYRKLNRFAITLPVLSANITCDKYSNDLQSKFECYTNTNIYPRHAFFFVFSFFFCFSNIILYCQRLILNI